MPKKPVFKDYQEYIVVYTNPLGNTYTQECAGSRAAIDVYRQLRKFYGDNVRLTKVVLNYGEEV